MECCGNTIKDLYGFSCPLKCSTYILQSAIFKGENAPAQQIAGRSNADKSVFDQPQIGLLRGIAILAEVGLRTSQASSAPLSKDLRNFLDYVDNRDVENDEYVDELKDYIHNLSKNTEWRNEYLDNQTHMMFHDEDVREEGIAAGKMEAIRGMIALMRNNGIAEEKLKPQIQTQFDLTDAQMQELFK